ncbi:TatD family hydrolase [Tistrella bauzanensis]|uniref:TatD family hydrolase n=1 Tax=Tistrella TaxID=171436 RepID=UPI0031F6EA6F
MLVDSHCHLDFADFDGELDTILDAARAQGVRAFQTISTRLSTYQRVRAVAAAHDDVWCSVGIHPHEAGPEGPVAAETLIGLAADDPKVIGIGETGLDYYYGKSPREDQIRTFEAHCAASRATGLPVIIHTRDADDDTIAVLERQMGQGVFPGLIHCFTGTDRLADAALAMGLSISISGIITFRNAEELRQTVKRVPLDKLLVETDAPYLAPVPKRGKRNEPAFVAYTAAFLADLKGVSAGDLAIATTDNFYRLFSKAVRPALSAAAG